MPALSVIDQRVGLDRQPAPLPQSPIYVSPNDPSSSHVGSHAYFIPPIYFDRHYLPNLPIHAHAEGGMSPSAALNYLSVPVASGPWSAHVQQNPYPLPPLPPPQTPHKVWILDCRTCGTFLTNRGMKAVLLLRPNVSLFSTDALPVNCSAYSTNPDALRPPPCHLSIAPRTCECLTQTLCCHTCGASIGYIIVIPCSRCTSSTSSNNRTTNGHRFVFHSNEIIATVRHHIPDEPGVIPVQACPPPPSGPPLSPLDTVLTRDTVNVAAHWQMAASSPLTSHPSPSSPLHSPELTPSPVGSSPDLFPSPLPDLPLPIPGSPPRTSGSTTTYASEPPPVQMLKAGDMLHWHQLSKTGEIPGVEEDPRARTPTWHRRGRFLDR